MPNPNLDISKQFKRSHPEVGKIWKERLQNAEPYWGSGRKHIIFIFKDPKELTKLYGKLSTEKGTFDEVSNLESFFKIGKNCLVAYFETDYRNFPPLIQEYFKNDLKPREYNEIETTFIDLIQGSGKISIEKIGAHVSKKSATRRQWFKQFKDTYLPAIENAITTNSSTTSLETLNALKKSADLPEICINALKEADCYSGYNDSLLFIFKDKEFLKTFYKKILQYSRINNIALEQDLSRFFKLDDRYLVIFYKKDDQLSEERLQKYLEEIQPADLDAENKNKFYKEMQTSGRKSMESIAGVMTRNRGVRVSDSCKNYFELLKDYYHHESGKFFADQTSSTINSASTDSARPVKRVRKQVIKPKKSNGWIDIFEQAECFHGKDSDLILYFRDSKYFEQQVRPLIKRLKNGNRKNQYFKAKNFLTIAKQYLVIMRKDAHENLPAELSEYFIELGSKIKSYEMIAEDFVKVCNDGGVRYICQYAAGKDAERKAWFEKFSTNYMDSELYKTAAANKKRKKKTSEDSLEPPPKRPATPHFFPRTVPSGHSLGQSDAMDIPPPFLQTEQLSPMSLDIEEIDPKLLHDSIAALNL